MLRAAPDKRWSLNRIFNHLLHYMHHSDDPVSEDSVEEEEKKEEAKRAEQSQGVRRPVARSRTLAGKQPNYMNGLKRHPTPARPAQRSFRD